MTTHGLLDLELRGRGKLKVWVDKVDQNQLSALLKDSTRLYIAWMAALASSVAMIVLYRPLGIMLSGLLISVFVLCYLWVLLLVRLDQLVTLVGKNPRAWVYLPLALPIVGTMLSYFCVWIVAKKLQHTG